MKYASMLLKCIISFFLEITGFLAFLLIVYNIERIVKKKTVYASPKSHVITPLETSYITPLLVEAAPRCF